MTEGWDGQFAPPPPTAQPSSAETIDTERRLQEVGLRNQLHELPFQCSIVPRIPTAHPSVAETIATESSVLKVGGLISFQLLPFQRMTTEFVSQVGIG